MEESIYFQANDLMLGDWIKIGKVPLRVIQLTHFAHKDDSVVLETGSEYLDVEPIPLTAEILEKNGWNVPQAKLWWECFNVGFWLRQYVDGRFEIMTDEDSDCIFTTNRYVHELQHALRLCGIDKEIVL